MEYAPVCEYFSSFALIIGFKMTTDKKAIRACIDAAAEQYNASSSADKQIKLEDNTPLFGVGGAFDSLGLVRFLASVEEECYDTLGKEVVLSDERAFFAEKSPFASVDSLVEYIAAEA